MKNMTEQKFYLACLRDNVGSNTAFHAINGKGYVTDIRKAEVYSREQAQKAWECGRSYDFPVSKFWVDSLSTFHVDCQHVPVESILDRNCDKFVGFVKGKFDGNDLYWLCDNYIPVTDFSNASFYDAPDPTIHGIVWLPQLLVETVKRPVFPHRLIDRKTMIQHCGLKQPDWFRKERRRKHHSLKIRMNCPDCGRINWQLNPYSFEGCNNALCPSYRHD